VAVLKESFQPQNVGKVDASIQVFNTSKTGGAQTFLRKLFP